MKDIVLKIKIQNVIMYCFVVVLLRIEYYDDTKSISFITDGNSHSE